MWQAVRGLRLFAASAGGRLRKPRLPTPLPPPSAAEVTLPSSTESECKFVAVAGAASEPKMTPLMTQYFKLKAENPDHLWLFRIGMCISYAAP